jgi:hypothetical protein
MEQTNGTIEAILRYQTHPPGIRLLADTGQRMTLILPIPQVQPQDDWIGAHATILHDAGAVFKMALTVS